MNNTSRTDMINSTVCWAREAEIMFREVLPYLSEKETFPVQECCDTIKRAVSILERKRAEMMRSARKRHDFYSDVRNHLGDLNAISDVFIDKVIKFVATDSSSLANLALTSTWCKRAVEESGALPHPDVLLFYKTFGDKAKPMTCELYPLASQPMNKFEGDPNFEMVRYVRDKTGVRMSYDNFVLYLNKSYGIHEKMFQLRWFLEDGGRKNIDVDRTHVPKLSDLILKRIAIFGENMTYTEAQKEEVLRFLREDMIIFLNRNDGRVHVAERFVHFLRNSRQNMFIAEWIDSTKYVNIS
jgi:hypothetical protein